MGPKTCIYHDSCPPRLLTVHERTHPNVPPSRDLGPVIVEPIQSLFFFALLDGTTSAAKSPDCLLVSRHVAALVDHGLSSTRSGGKVIDVRIFSGKEPSLFPTNSSPPILLVSLTLSCLRTHDQREVIGILMQKFNINVF